MIRSLHRWPGLIAAALLVVLSLSGAVLSVLPASEALRTPSPGDISVAALTERIAVRISRRTKAAIEARAKKARRSAADWVRLVIEDATGTGPDGADQAE